MSKKSVVVSGMGLGLGMLTNADQIRKEVGITAEQFHILATEEGRKHWRHLFERMKVSENCYETCTVTLGGFKSLEDVIEAGNYNCRNNDIISEGFPVMEGEMKNVEIVLVHRNKNEQSQNLIDEMDKAGYRPAHHEELLALGAQHPEMQRKFPIIALGTVVQIGGARSVLCLGGWGGERRLFLHWFVSEWTRVCRFAFVRKI